MTHSATPELRLYKARLYLLHPHLSLELLVPTRPWDSGRLLQEAEVLISLRAVSPALLSVGIALACGFPGGSNDPLPSASKENQDHLYLVTDQSPSQGICRATSTPLTTPMSLCCLCPLNTKLCSPNWSFGVCGLLPNCVPRLSLIRFSFAVRVLQSSLLAARQAPPDVPTAADLVSAIEKLVKNKLVSGHAGGSSELPLTSMWLPGPQTGPRTGLPHPNFTYSNCV